MSLRTKVDYGVTVTEFDSLIVSVYCRVSQKLSLVAKKWYGGRTSCYGPEFAGWSRESHSCSSQSDCTQGCMIQLLNEALQLHCLIMHALVIS